MRVLSAADSVSPAIQRTRELLFKPFSWGTYLKLGLVAIITEGAGSNLRSSHSGISSPGNGSVPHWPQHFGPEWIVAIFALALVMVIVLFIGYLITRLRFAFFHCLIHNVKEIRPGWWIYRDPATRFFWLNVVVGFCFLLLVGLIAIPFVGGFMRLFQETQQGTQFDLGLLLSLLLPLIPIIFLVALTGFVTDLILRDFMLPHYALENATAGEAWERVWAHIKAEKRQFFVYALLRVILPILAVIGLFILLLVPGIVLGGALLMVELGLHSAFADSTGGSAAVGMMLEVFFGALAFGFMLLARVCLGGPVSTWIREYALTFYGGRYQVLGDILYPPISRPA
jgi:hypothetical protein